MTKAGAGSGSKVEDGAIANPEELGLLLFWDNSPACILQHPPHDSSSAGSGFSPSWQRSP